jgi:hypothetical protein
VDSRPSPDSLAFHVVRVRQNALPLVSPVLPSIRGFSAKLGQTTENVTISAKELRKSLICLTWVVAKRIFETYSSPSNKPKQIA